MPNDLAGRVVVVTGGNGGIGLGIARGIARAGGGVAIWARDRAKNEAALGELESLGGEGLAIECDVTDPNAVANAAARTKAELGPIDALFANAGITGPERSFLDVDLDTWRQVHAVNTEGALLVMQAAARQMVADRRPGALIGVASTSVFYGAPNRSAYASSKSSLVSLCRSMAVELARHRIRCNVLVPGWTDTDMLDHSRDNHRFVENTTTRTPVRRWGSPSDFEGPAAFLADPSQQFHTGDQLVVDGGYRIY